LWIFTLQFCEFSVILWSNIYNILEFNRNKIYVHNFAILKFWFLKKKSFADFFRAIREEKKYWKNTVQESCTNKGTILHQKSIIKFFLTYPFVYIYMVLAIAGQTAEPNWRKFWGNLWLTKIKLNFSSQI